MACESQTRGAPADLGDPQADFDKDGLSNRDERVWGLDPTRGTSVSAISVPLDPATHSFRYARREPALTGLVHTVWTSTNLKEWTPENPGGWTKDAGAVQTPGSPDANHVETVDVTLSITPPEGGKLLVQVRATAQ